MRVLHYLDNLGRGGAEMQALDVCRNAARFGIEVTLAAADGGGLESAFYDSGVDMVRFGRKAPVDLYLASQLRKLISDRQIEIVHGYQPVDGLHLYLATRSLKHVKRVLSFQGFIGDRKNRFVSRYLIPKMDANIVVSEGLRNWLRQKDKLKLENKSVVIHNGADPDRLKPRGHSIRRELEIAADTPLIGMVANFYRDDRKDQLTVCKALTRVFEAVPDAHCFFAGRVDHGGEEKLADCINLCIDNKMTDRVHFLGARTDVPDLLAEMDIFVFSTLHEGLPVAVCEAMLAGVPVVASDIEPILEISRNGEFAEIFPVRDAGQLAERIIGLAIDRERRSSLAARARTHAEAQFSITAHLSSLKKLYDGLLSN